jgi:hypothetical protein
MARFKLKADGDFFTDDIALGEFDSIEEASKRVEVLENMEQFIGYDLILTDTLLRVEYFYTNGDWERC